MRTRTLFGQPVRRHACEEGWIYSSFDGPGFRVPPEQTQRDSGKRFAKFGIAPDGLTGLRVLDLGCNVGGTSFTAVSHGAAHVLGIEYDREKVVVADRIAKFCHLVGIEFREGDIDALTAADLPEVDVVFCLAIETHIRDVPHLYSLLGEVTGRTLYFEGNSDLVVKIAMQRLRDVGFREVVAMGQCDDDRFPENNTRPLLVAHR